MNKEYLSKKAKEYTFYSNPSKPVLNAFSGGKGVLSMEWDDQDNLAGYDIQYSKNSDFSEYKNEQISDGATRNFSVKDLSVGEVYYTRVGHIWLLMIKRYTVNGATLVKLPFTTEILISARLTQLNQ